MIPQRETAFLGALFRDHCSVRKGQAYDKVFSQGHPPGRTGAADDDAAQLFSPRRRANRPLPVPIPAGRRSLQALYGVPAAVAVRRRSAPGWRSVSRLEPSPIHLWPLNFTGSGWEPHLGSGSRNCSGENGLSLTMTPLTLTGWHFTPCFWPDTGAITGHWRRCTC